MNEIEFLAALKELFPNSSLFLLVLWSLWLLKSYVINGNIKRYFDMKEKESGLIGNIYLKIAAIEKQHEVVEKLAMIELEKIGDK